MLSEKELQELEMLIKMKEIDNRKKTLCKPTSDANPNYQFLYNSINSQKYDNQGDLISGYRGIALEGSSRSGKTWSVVDICIYISLYLEKSCTINIYRQTYNEFKTTLYDDFKRRLDDFGIYNPFHRAKEIKSFKIKDSTIYFLGDGKHGGGCDYAFFNEIMFIENSVFDQSEMRCRKFWIADYNPSVTEHWFFDKVLKRSDVGFLRTTWKDNPFISFGEKNKILSYEPFLPNSYIVKDDTLCCYNKATKKVEPISKTNQPTPHPQNITNGTADLYMWKVYGLGLRGAMKGVIFQFVEWIEEFPIDKSFIYGNDFGFTTDPNVLVKYYEDDYNIWVECLSYEPIESSNELYEFMLAVGVTENDLVICDSSDKYTGENKGTVEMVKDLRKKGLNARKVSKTKSVMFWLTSMKQKKIHIVKNQFYNEVKKEKENYRLREVGGVSLNEPIDSFNHFWDAARYAHIIFNNKLTTHQTTASLEELGIYY